MGSKKGDRRLDGSKESLKYICECRDSESIRAWFNLKDREQLTVEESFEFVRILLKRRGYEFFTFCQYANINANDFTSAAFKECNFDIASIFAVDLFSKTEKEYQQDAVGVGYACEKEVGIPEITKILPINRLLMGTYLN